MSVLRDFVRVPFPFSLALAASLGVLAGGTLSACGDDAPAESCYELVDFEEEAGLLCDTTQADRASLTNGRYSETFSACVPQSECPDACPAQDVIASTVLPMWQSDPDYDPDFVVDEVIPLCVKNDIGAGNCCFWSLLVGDPPA